MIHFELEENGAQHCIVKGDFYMVEIMLLLENIGKRLQHEDGTDWRVHILNMAEVVANPDITVEEITEVVAATSTGKRWRPQ